jgi:tartrate dehydratase beta subunit/fumarate hydratase class I family protein
MTLVKDIRKTVTDTTPVYAVVGVTDLAVERLRDARSHATAVRLDLDISAMQHKAVKRFEKVTEQAQQIPAQFRNQTFEAAGRARETYSGLAIRGEKLVKRIRNQKSTKDLFAQAGSTMSLGKGAVTTVRNAAHDTQRAAMVTLAAGRREAGSVAASVQDDVRATGRTAKKTPAKTPTVVQGTGTTAKKSTASAERATRSVAAGARKSASTATRTVTPKADS